MMRAFTISDGEYRSGIEISRIVTVDKVFVPVVSLGGDGEGRFRTIIPVGLMSGNMDEFESNNKPIILATEMRFSLKRSRKLNEVLLAPGQTTPQALVFCRGIFTPIAHHPDYYPPQIVGRGIGIETETLVIVSQNKPFQVESGSRPPMILLFTGQDLMELS